MAAQPLYKIVEQTREIEDAIHALEEAGWDPESEKILYDALIGLDEDITEKLARYCRVIRNFEATAAICKSEAENLRNRATVSENAVKRLKAVMLNALGFLELSNVQAGPFKVTVCNNGGWIPMRLKIDDPKDLPGRFQKVKVEADTQAIREALDAGEVEAFQVAEFEERGKHVRIR